MMKLSIIIPVYNEEKTINKVLDKVLRVPLKKIKKEIIIVDDFSTDRSRKILNLLKKKNIKVFYHKKNMGKGYALRTGLKHITGDIILIQDADLEYNPDEYQNLLDPIIKGKAMVVYGNRFTGYNKPKYRIYYLGNLALTFFTNLLYGSKINDMETCYKVFRKEALKNINLKSRRFDFEPEITAKFLKKGYKIHQVPISYQSRSIKEGKKIGWKDGLEAFYYLIKYRFMD